jgi:hypothetical protein
METGAAELAGPDGVTAGFEEAMGGWKGNVSI